MSPDRIDMNTERDPLGLAALPDAMPPRDAWTEISRRLSAQERSARRRWWPAAAAALLVASLGLIVLLSGELEQQQGEIDEWIAYSQLLETELSQLRERNSVLRGHEAVAVSELEDLVAMVDDRLTRPDADELTLWQQRAAIMNDLVTVHAVANDRRWQPSARPAPVMTRNLSAQPRLQPASYQQ